MNEHERILQKELQRIADEAQLRPGMFETTLRRANRRRNFALTSSAAALVAVAIVAALLIPDGRDGREDLTSPEIQPGVVRLLTQPRGLLEIEASRGQLCYRFGMRGVTDTQVVHRESEEVAIDLGGNDQLLGVVGCRRGMDPQALAMVARSPSAYVVWFENSESGGSEAADLRHDTGRPSCYPTPPTSQEYSLHFSRLHGRPGDVIEVWAPTLRDQGGRYSPSDGLELWWNSRTPDGLQPITDGPALRLFSADTRDRCYVQESFEVPEVVEGTYRLTGFMFDDPRSDGYGIWPGPRFTVTSGEDDQQSAGVQVETETIDIGDQPIAVAAEGDSVWVTTGRRRELLEIRDGGIVNRFDGGGGVGVAVGDGTAWLAAGGDGAEPDGSLTGIDLDSGSVVQRVEFPAESPYGVDGGAEGVFTALAQGDLVRLDPDGEGYTRIPLADGLRDVLVAHDAVWVAQSEGQNPRVWRVTVDDDGSNAAPLVMTPQGKGSCPAGLAATAEAMWVADPCGAVLWKLDPSGKLLGRIENVGEKPADVAAGPRFLFVSSFRDDEIVTIIDQRTEKVVEQVQAGEGPSAIVADGQGAWVANSEGRSLTHIVPRVRRR